MVWSRLSRSIGSEQETYPGRKCDVYVSDRLSSSRRFPPDGANLARVLQTHKSPDGRKRPHTLENIWSQFGRALISWPLQDVSHT